MEQETNKIPTVEELWDELEAENFEQEGAVETPPPQEAVPVKKEETPPTEVEETPPDLDSETPPLGEDNAISPELKQMFEALNKKIDSVSTLQDRVRKTEGMLGSLSDQVKKSREALQNQPSPEELQKALELEKKLEALAANDPELWDGINSKFSPLQKDIDSLRKQIDSLAPDQDSLNSLVKTKAEELYQERIERDREKELEFLQSVRPDYVQVLNSDGFKSWHKSQTPDVQALIRSYSARDYLVMLRMFDESKKDEDKNEDRLRQAASTPKREATAAPPTAKNEEDMTPEEYWEHNASSVWKEG